MRTVPILALAIWTACATPPRPVPPVPPPAPITARLLDPIPPNHHQDLPQADAKARGLDVAALSQLVLAAERSKSASLLVVADGTVVVERYFEPPQKIQLRSVAKMFTGAAIGLLIEDKNIADLDLPISTWFPEWSDGRRAKVTLRHVLSHTSGIEHQQGDTEMVKQADTVAWVRTHGVVTEPGAVYSYNNDAVQLLSGIVSQVAGKPLDAYLDERLFRPLGLSDWKWTRDAAGNTFGWAGLALHARDVARFGALLLQRGAWKGQQVLPAAWIDRSTKPQDPKASYGLLHEVLYGSVPVTVTATRLGDLASTGFSATEKLRPFVGRTFPSTWHFFVDVPPGSDVAQRPGGGRSGGT